MKDLKEKYRQFRKWQQQPYQVAPLSETERDCPTCGTHFTGNYCPRCGQSSRIGRYSIKKAFLLFLDVWGLGNRGMFRTLRDLILRPGYMIRDYLQGMQMAYFPPFKMFFLLVALGFLVETSLNIRHENRYEIVQFQVEESINKAFLGDEAEDQKLTAQEAAENKEAADNAKDISNKINEWVSGHVSLVLLMTVFLFSWPLYLMFRKSPAYPGIKYSEFFVATVYIYNMLLIYSIVINFFCLNPLIEVCFSLLTIIPLKQLSGYSYGQTLLRIIAAIPLFIVIVVILGVLISVGIGIYFWLK